MVKVVFVIALLGLIAVQVECLKCYTCEDCDKEKDSKECETEGLPDTKTYKYDEAPGGSSSPAPGGSSSPAPGGSSSPAADGSSSPAPGGSSSPAPDGSSTQAPTSTVKPSTLKCFKVVITDGDSTKVNRGCTAKTCEDFKTKYDKDYKECGVCDKENCNPASNVKSWALSSVILVAIVKMFL